MKVFCLTFVVHVKIPNHCHLERSLVLVMPSDHLFLSCRAIICSCHVERSFVLVMSSDHLFLSCRMTICSCHLERPFIIVMSSDHLFLSSRATIYYCHVERPTGVETSSYMSALKISPLTSFGRNDKMGHFSLHNLKFSLPQTMDVAVFVDCDRLA